MKFMPANINTPAAFALNWFHFVRLARYARDKHQSLECVSPECIV